jgi:hypothetical protein
MMLYYLLNALLHPRLCTVFCAFFYTCPCLQTANGFVSSQLCSVFPFSVLLLVICKLPCLVLPAVRYFQRNTLLPYQLISDIPTGTVLHAGGYKEMSSILAD